MSKVFTNWIDPLRISTALFLRNSFHILAPLPRIDLIDDFFADGIVGGDGIDASDSAMIIAERKIIFIHPHTELFDGVLDVIPNTVE